MNAQEKMMKLVGNFILPRALYVAAHLNIADILDAQAMNINDLAVATQCHAQALHRLLRFLLNNEVFAQNVDGQFCNSELSLLMRTQDASGLRDLLLHEDETCWNAYGHMLFSVQTGKPAFDHLYQMDYFSYLHKHPHLQQQFDVSMSRVSQSEEELIAEVYPFDQFQSVMDIGGGQGGLLKQIMQKYPQLHAILFEQKEVVAQFSEQNFPEHCQIQTGSFFDSILAEAQLYTLKRILHDWDDQKCLQILRNIHKAMSANGRLLVIEAIAERGKNSKRIHEIDLLLLTLFGGVERTESEFHTLFTRAGLQIIRIIDTDSLISLIEIKKI